MGVPSQIEYASGTVESSVNVPLTGVPLREELSRRFGVPVYVDNDANCAALAEAQLVDDAPVSVLLMLTLGTGVGGGVVIDGQIFRGAHGMGAELGHFTVDPDGPPCPATARAAAASRRTAAARRWSATPPSSPVTCPAAGCRRPWTSGPRERARSWRRPSEGDADALRVFDRFARMLGVAIAGYVNVFEPVYIVIGGGLSNASTSTSRAPWTRPDRGPCPPCGSGHGLPGPRRSRRGSGRRGGARSSRVGARYCRAGHHNDPGSRMTTSTAATDIDELSINTIRTLSMDAVQKANSGHPGAPMALAPIAYLLYTRLMKHNPADPGWFDRDRFVLSAGHASMLLYSTLHLSGYGVSLEDLENFRQLGSPTPGHPEHEADGAPGVEVTTGPLGQGISTPWGSRSPSACSPPASTAADEIIDHYTYAIASDGDMQEGVASEASSLAGHLASAA